MNCHLDVVSLEKLIFSGLINSVQVSGIEGQLGIFPGHSPLLSLLKPGMILITSKNKNNKDCIYISGGIIEVQPSTISILVDSAIRGIDLNKNLILKTKKCIEKKMKNASINDQLKLINRLSLELAKLNVIEYISKTSNIR